MILYWIRYDHHTDIKSEGYVGITKNRNTLYHREWRHRNRSENPILLNALNKGASLEVYEEFETEDEARAREFDLRPEREIGWNIEVGGGIPPAMTKERATPEFCEAVSKGKKRNWEENGDELRKNFQRESFKRRMSEISRSIPKFSCLNCRRVMKRNNLKSHTTVCYE